jgi:hypothetical protein
MAVTIQALTSGTSRQKIMSLKTNEMNAWIKSHREVEHELIKVSHVYSVKTLCECLISSVNIATAYWDDVDHLSEWQRLSSVIMNSCHSSVTPEKLSWKLNIGLETA